MSVIVQVHASSDGVRESPSVKRIALIDHIIVSDFSSNLPTNQAINMP